MALQDVFKEAAERVKQLKSASDEDRLELYSLYKQSNAGDCATGLYSFEVSWCGVDLCCRLHS